MTVHTQNIFRKILIAAFLLTGIFSIQTFTQNSPKEEPASAPRLNPKLPDEPANGTQFSPSQEALRNSAKAFPDARGASNAIADAALDPTFAANLSNFPGRIQTTAFQADGKMLVGGFFNRPGGEEHHNLFRSDPVTGTIDPTFNPKVSETVYSIAVQPDGKILIGGGFTRVNGVSRNRIARLNADGSLDTTFNPPGGTDNAVYSLSLQPDGKIIVAGFFTNVNGDARSNIVRLNADGTTDYTFELQLENTGFVYSTLIQPDGKILVGGFYALQGNSINATILRFNANGSVDFSFNALGTGANSTVRDIKLQADGKIVIGGNFTTYNSTTRNRVARLNTDGTLDAAFAPANAANSVVQSVAVLSSGKILIGGFFTTYETVSRNFIAQLNANGSLDTSFNPGTGFNGGVYEVTAIPSSTNIYAGGNFTIYNNQTNVLGTALSATGGELYRFTTSAAAPLVRATLIQPDGRILVGGAFNIANNVNHNSLVRLNADGTNDATFFAGTGTNAQIYAMAWQPDGKILIGGSFTTYNGTTRNRIARVNADGTLDETFAADANSAVSGITVQPDGKILVGGGFSQMNGVQRSGLARLNANGTLDTTLNFNSPLAYVEGVAVQADGKIVVGGIFSAVDNVTRFSLARLNSNGSLDSSFTPGILPNAGIYSLAIQADGKILAGGTFSVFGSSGIQNGIARFNPDGTRDHDFLIGAGTSVNDDVEDIVVQPNGKILIGGAISSLNGVARNNLARLNANGTLDLSFNPIVDNTVWDINVESSGARRILIGGDFWIVNNNLRSGVARFIPDLPFNRTPFDFDGDARTDFSIFRPSVGEWWINRSSTGQTVAAQFGASTDKPVPADFTGDGKTDIAFWRPATGEWFILRSEDGSFYSVPFGAAGDVPLVGDFDADGRSDLTIYRPSTGEWFISKSTGGVSIITFGISGDVPVAADYDGDGKTDLAIYRPSLGEWWIQRSSNLSIYAFQFGAAADKPVPGDYTGDGRADSAFWRPASGEWFILRSEDGSFYSVPFGLSTDKPVPGDYDGDGRYDIAVFRPSTSRWFVDATTYGTIIAPFGASGDQPLPNVFVP